MKQVHEKIKNHKCSVCSYACYRKSDFRKHMLTVHDSSKDFKCELCNEIFLQNSFLIKHKATFHKNIESPLKTSYDKEILITEEQDNRNTPISKTFNCDECKERGRSKLCLAKHIREIHLDSDR